MDTERFAKQLRDLKARVRKTVELSHTGARPVELDQNRVGRLSRMDAMQGQAMAKANEQRQRQLLTEIERAEARLLSGDYGRCIECDDFIVEARLSADPTVQTCIGCASASERAPS